MERKINLDWLKKSDEGDYSNFLVCVDIKEEYDVLADIFKEKLNYEVEKYDGNNGLEIDYDDKEISCSSILSGYQTKISFTQAMRYILGLDNKAKEMTLADVCKELGRDIKIIKE